MKDENENNQANWESENFGLPEGYFQKSAGSIMNKIEWQEEHKDLPRLSELKNSNAFLIPENYFYKSEQKLELIEYPTLNKLEAINPFSLPWNYFEELEVSELTKVLGENKNDDFPTLASLKKQDVFQVPQNYFTGTEKIISGKINPKKETKVISLFTKRVSFAVAAMFVIALGLWLYNFYFAPIEPIDCGTIACLDKQDLVKSKNLENLEDEQLYDLVDPSALEKKLDIKNTDKIKNKSKDSSLNSLSEEELLEDI